MLLFVDCETGPREDAIRFTRPFQPNRGWKDPVKIAAAEAEYNAEVLEGAALDPLTAQILMISVGDLHGHEYLLEQNGGGEKFLLSLFWEMVRKESYTTLVGFCSESFDLPMLFARSWAQGITPPPYFRRGKWWSDYSIDLHNVWMCGRQAQKDRPKNDLGTICRMLGLGDKNGCGKDFFKLYAEDPVKAREYALNDLRLTRLLYGRLMGDP